MFMLQLCIGSGSRRREEADTPRGRVSVGGWLRQCERCTHAYTTAGGADLT